MKTVGIVGGIGPESTVDYYRLMLAAYRRQRPDGSAPSILINSIDLKKMLDLIAADQLVEVTEYLAGEVNKLARAGADFGLLAANTPHIVFADIQRQSSIPLMSIVKAACRAAEALRLRKVGLIGTRFTMQGHFYADAFAEQGIDLVAPGLEDQAYIHDKYMSELVAGIFKDETRQRSLAIVDRLIEQEHIQGLILGGTELPLLLRAESYKDIPFLDTTKIHVARALTEMLA